MEEALTPLAAAADVDLARGFDAFIEAARCLEQSYAALQARAEAVDLQLADTNRRLEETLRERETVLSALPVGLVALDPDAETVWTNPEGDRVIAAIASESIAALPCGEREIDGLSLRVQRVDLPDGGTLIVAEDRSQVVHLVREVDRLDRLAGLSELALGVAHEIKNPLNGVMGFAELLNRSTVDPRSQRYVDKMLEGLELIDGIVKAMLAFARPSQSRGRAVAVEDLVRQAAAEAGVPTDRVHLRRGAELIGDASLVRVLANLLRNSVEATGCTRIDVEAHLESATRGECLVLTVADDGPGIADEIAARLFEPFVSTKERGHGLGLALAARVMTYLGGSLSLVDAGSGGASGARFEIRLAREVDR